MDVFLYHYCCSVSVASPSNPRVIFPHPDSFIPSLAQPCRAFLRNTVWTAIWTLPCPLQATALSCSLQKACHSAHSPARRTNQGDRAFNNVDPMPFWASSRLQFPFRPRPLVASLPFITLVLWCSVEGSPYINRGSPERSLTDAHPIFTDVLS